VLKRIIFFSFFLILIFFAIKNILQVTIQFQASNITINQSFNNQNTISKKGTHEGGETYLNNLRHNMYLISRLKINEIYQIYINLKNSNIENSNFYKEYEIINLIYELSKLPNKKHSMVYIRNDLDEFWDISCDSHLASFIVPAIANISMIRGLPNLEKKSCFGHKLEYGHFLYYNNGNSFETNILEKKYLCKILKDQGMKFLIYLDYDFQGKITYFRYRC